jgi:hypothetical protein
VKVAVGGGRVATGISVEAGSGREELAAIVELQAGKSRSKMMIKTKVDFGIRAVLRRKVDLNFE